MGRGQCASGPRQRDRRHDRVHPRTEDLRSQRARQPGRALHARGTADRGRGTRALVYRATELFVAGKDVTQLASMAKLKSGRLTREVADKCLQFWGGMGFTWENPLSRLYRDGRVGLDRRRRRRSDALDHRPDRRHAAEGPGVTTALGLRRRCARAGRATRGVLVRAAQSARTNAMRCHRRCSRRSPALRRGGDRSASARRRALGCGRALLRRRGFRRLRAAGRQAVRGQSPSPSTTANSAACSSG